MNPQYYEIGIKFSLFTNNVSKRSGIPIPI